MGRHAIQVASVAGNIATGNEACVVNELCRSVALITFRH